MSCLGVFSQFGKDYAVHLASNPILETDLPRGIEESVLVGQQHSQVAQIIPRRTDHDGVTQRLKERIGIGSRKMRIQIQSAGPSAFDCTAIDDRSSGGAGAVSAVGARAEYANRCGG